MMPVFFGIVVLTTVIPLSIQELFFGKGAEKELSNDWNVIFTAMLWFLLHWFWWVPKSKVLIYFNPRATIFPAMISMLSALLVAMFMQQYVNESRYEIVNISSISELSEWPEEKYFSIQEIRKDTDWIGEHFNKSIEQRDKDRTVFHGYLVVGLKNSNDDQAKSLPKVWIGEAFRLTNDNVDDNIPGKNDWEIFKNLSRKTFNEKSYTFVQYFERLGKYKIEDSYARAIENISHAYHPEMIVILPHFTRFPDHPDKWWKYALLTFAIGMVFMLLHLFGPDIHRQAAKTGK